MVKLVVYKSISYGLPKIKQNKNRQVYPFFSRRKFLGSFYTKKKLKKIIIICISYIAQDFGQIFIKSPWSSRHQEKAGHRASMTSSSRRTGPSLPGPRPRVQRAHH